MTDLFINKNVFYHLGVLGRSGAATATREHVELCNRNPDIGDDLLSPKSSRAFPNYPCPFYGSIFRFFFQTATSHS
jgi:hypothetical protein